MLKDILKGNIQIGNNVSCWQESIQKAAYPLLQNNDITENYIKAMIQNVLDNGSYMVLLPEFALPHSRPDHGVNKTSLSLLKLKEPIIFPDDVPVRLLIVLAAIDTNTHLDILFKLVDLVMDETKMKQILSSETIDEIMEIL